MPSGMSLDLSTHQQFNTRSANATAHHKQAEDFWQFERIESDIAGAGAISVCSPAFWIDYDMYVGVM